MPVWSIVLLIVIAVLIAALVALTIVPPHKHLLGSYGTIAPSTGNLPAPTSAPSPTAVTLSPTPASAKADRGSDSVRVQGVHML